MDTFEGRFWENTFLRHFLFEKVKTLFKIRKSRIHREFFFENFRVEKFSRHRLKVLSLQILN